MQQQWLEYSNVELSIGNNYKKHVKLLCIQLAAIGGKITEYIQVVQVESNLCIKHSNWLILHCCCVIFLCECKDSHHCIVAYSFYIPEWAGADPG